MTLAKSASGLVRTGTFNLLSAKFNSALASAAADYPNLTVFTIDFTSPRSTSFFYGRLDLADIETSSTYSENLMTYFMLRSVNQNLEKGGVFSGTVQVGIDLWITYRAGNAHQDFESLPECLEETFYNIFNARNNATYWGNRVAFNGDIQIGVGPLVIGGKGWRRLVTATLTFEVSI